MGRVWVRALMWIVSSATYWSSLGLLAYTYAGYPLLVCALARLRPRPARIADLEPRVSIVLAAHDERAHLRDKLEALLALDYPEDRRELIVVSDGSTDGTDELARALADRGVILERLDRPSGKPAALNRGVARATGELIVFCDARQRVSRGALRALVRRFADPDVGAVSGELHMPGERGPGVYWRYEAFIRAHESSFDSIVGATGALYAIRRRLFRRLPEDSLDDDLFTPLQIALRGYRVVVVPGAARHDDEATLSVEFDRKARTLAGNFQLLRHLPQLLHPLRNRLWFQLVSHKLLRLACPFALAGLFASNAILVLTLAPGWPLYACTLGAQLGAYGLALHGARAGERAGKLARISHTFAVLNLAAVEGLRRFLTSDLKWTRLAAAPAPEPVRPPRRRAARARPSPIGSRIWSRWCSLREPGVLDAYSLMYHDVVRASARTASGFDGPDADTYKLDADLFERHLAAISDAVTRTDLERVASARELTWRGPSSRSVVLLHFDDGGACALDVADRLERAGWRGYFHITTDRIGTAGFVTASELRELHARGHVIGSHSCSHPPRMSRLPWEEMLREWLASKATLEELLGAPVTVASVPGGACSRRVIRAADLAGIEVLFTSEPTSRFDWIRGCLVLGRYAIRRTTRPDEAARLAIGAPLPRWEQWAAWNAKKVLKRLGGAHWPAMRGHLLRWMTTLTSSAGAPPTLGSPRPGT